MSRFSQGLIIAGVVLILFIMAVAAIDSNKISTACEYFGQFPLNEIPAKCYRFYK